MNRIERWYRVALTAYPPDYLAEREEELVTTLLAATPANADRPPLRELVSLVRNGVAERNRRFGSATRRQGLAAASHLALGLFAALTAFVAGPQLTPSWSEPPPRLFLPFWLAFSAGTVLAHIVRARYRRWVRLGLLVVLLVGLQGGPAHVLAWRSALVSLGALALVASLRPATAGRWPAAATALAGGWLGAVAGQRQLSRELAAYHVGQLPFRGAWFGLVEQSNRFRWVLVGLAIVVAGAAWLAPRIGLALGLNALPLALAVLSMASPGPDRFDKVLDGLGFVVVACGAGVLAAGLAAASTLRARRTA